MSEPGEEPRRPSAAPAAASPTGGRRAGRILLALGLVGAGWFLWLMVQSGLDLRLRARVLELVKLAESPQAAEHLARARGTHPHLADFAIDPNGAVRLRLTGAPAIEGRAVALIPQAVDGKVVGWRCASDAPRQFLPRSCEAP